MSLFKTFWKTARIFLYCFIGVFIGVMFTDLVGYVFNIKNPGIPLLIVGFVCIWLWIWRTK